MENRFASARACESDCEARANSHQYQSVSRHERRAHALCASSQRVAVTLISLVVTHHRSDVYESSVRCEFAHDARKLINHRDAPQQPKTPSSSTSSSSQPPKPMNNGIGSCASFSGLGEPHKFIHSQSQSQAALSAPQPPAVAAAAATSSTMTVCVWACMI